MMRYTGKIVCLHSFQMVKVQICRKETRTKKTWSFKSVKIN